MVSRSLKRGKNGQILVWTIRKKDPAMNELEVDFDGPKQAKRKSVTFNLKDTENE